MNRGVIATANELFESKQYTGVVALISDALVDEPECVPLLLVRARARLALHRDLDAQGDLRDIIRLDPQCASAYRLLGELAVRRDEGASAAIFFREALRLAPHDRAAAEWLAILVGDPPARPAAAAHSLPAPAAAAGRFSSPSGFDGETVPYGERRPLARGSQPPPMRTTDDRGTEQVTLRGAQPVRGKVARLPERPGFGDYLVANGILTRDRLRAAEAYQRSMKVQLATAIVTLGLATPQRIEWAAVAHQAELDSR